MRLRAAAPASVLAWAPTAALAWAPAAVLAALLSNAACAKDPAVLGLGLEHFRDTATIKDDPQSATATISTKPGFVEGSGPLHMVWQDEFLTAVIDHKTGRKSFLVHQEITYSGNWRVYETASYQSSNGPRSVPATLIRKEAVNCLVGECTYTEELTFPVDDDSLRRLAADYVPGKPTLWPYQLTARSSATFHSGLSNAEIAGLLVKVDDYTGAPATIKAAPPPPPAPAKRLGLGVDGIAVAATEDAPKRSGILITAVDRGSVAHKAGIIVGDIVYEFNGHPINALAQLHSAVAGVEPNSAVPIRLYRGTDAVSVNAQF